MSAAPGDREAFLDRVRGRLADGIPTGHQRPITPDGSPPPIAYLPDGRDLVEVFTAGATSVGTTVVSMEDPATRVVELCAERNLRRAVVSADPECGGVADALVEAGIELVDVGDLDGSATADVGITGAAYGIALTGTLVVDSSRAGARTPSLLPPLHVALLRREAILPDAGSLLRNLGERLPGGLPSNLVFITGPSKSADIELELTVGVHGPRDLHIGLL